MNKKEPLQYDKYYHIYNRGNNSEILFRNEKNYSHFLKLYSIFIEPIAETYAWCLMNNHFHLLIRIKNENEIGYLNPQNKNNKDLSVKWKIYNTLQGGFTTLEGVEKPNPEKQFGHLFNAYARTYNLQEHRTGTLFEHTFERIPITNNIYLKNLVRYINNNPVHHKIVNNTIDYKWSSYLSIIEDKPTKIQRDKVIEWFDTKENFIEFHKNYIFDSEIQEFMIDFF